jgi:hypothetical protein
MRRYLPEANLPVWFTPWEEILSRAIAAGRPIWVWGAGSAGRAVLRQNANLHRQAKGLLDRDPAKHADLVDGLSVSGPDWLANSPKPRPFVVIATSFASEVARQLGAWGYAPAEDFCVADLG